MSRSSALNQNLSIPLWFCLTLAMRCSAQTPAAVQYESLPAAKVYDAGYLLSWDSPKYSQFTLYRLDAKPAYTVAEHKDGVYHWAWAVDSDGVTAGAYESRKTSTGRIDLFDPNGRLTLTIDTGAHIPEHVLFARDHTMWAISYTAGDDGSEDFDVLHHYSRTGQELGQALPWSRLESDHNSYTALQAILGARRLFSSDDRIAFVSHTHDGRSTWIEADSSGTFLEKYDLGRYGALSYMPVAMTASGSVYARIYKDQSFAGWATLDRSKAAWRKLAGYPKGQIIGSDGDNLVFSKDEGGWTVLSFVPSVSLHLAEPKPQTAMLVAPR